MTPAVYEEFQIGVTKGYTVLQPVIDLIEQEQIELLVPNAQEILQKSASALLVRYGRARDIDRCQVTITWRLDK